MTNDISTHAPLDANNYTSCFLEFQDREAGVSLVYCPTEDRFWYNAYCIERTLLKELFSVECDFLDEALDTINAEFGTWPLRTHDKKKDCGSCSAKK